MSDNANLYAHFQSHFPQDPDSQLLVTAEGRIVSYGEADEASAVIAQTLRALGAVAGDRITVQVVKSVESLCLYLACLRAGLVYHPLNTAYTAAELEYFINDAEPVIVVCANDALDAVNSALPSTESPAVLTLNADGSGSLMERDSVTKIAASVVHSTGADMAALLYSSGTTGRPKGIMLSHDNLRKSAQTLVEAWGFSSQDHLLHMLPIYHVHGLFVAVSCVMMSGASMSWHAAYDDQVAVSALPSCTVMMGVPTYYTRLLGNAEFGRECCANMRLFVSGSAPLLVETFHEFEARCGHRILERYGMSETNMNTSNPLHGERRAGTVGPALPGVELRLVNDEGVPVLSAGDDGAIGNLQVRGDNVFTGYWRMPDKTAEDFTADGFFDTGDKATIATDGYVTIVGRAKDLIICGGLNVYPREIELVIDDICGIKESAVIGVPHADFGEVVLAVIVVDDIEQGRCVPDAESIITLCRKKLANFKVPKLVEYVDFLPRNAMGKVQKNLLRQRFGSGI